MLAYFHCRDPVPKMSYGSGGKGDWTVLIVRSRCPISTQCFWQASVAITTPPRVAFLSHQPASSLLSVGALLTQSTGQQQTTTM